jgi:hypothetical protein
MRFCEKALLFEKGALPSEFEEPWRVSPMSSEFGEM